MTSESGIWEEYALCADPTESECIVQTDLLRVEPWSLEYADPVRARISAYNDSGWGRPSELDPDCKTVVPAVPVCAAYMSASVVPGSCLITYGRPDCIRNVPTEPITGYEL
jgi:hypothetical protein